jgi:tripartite-type tricarboxylate transporter receptor subunit TctC
MVTDIMGGQVDWGVTSLPSIQGHLKAGTRAIGVGSAQRTRPAPEIPVVEQGMPGISSAGSPSSVPRSCRGQVNVFTRVYRRADARVKEAMANRAMSQSKHSGGRRRILSFRTGQVREAGQEAPGPPSGA